MIIISSESSSLVVYASMYALATHSYCIALPEFVEEILLLVAACRQLIVWWYLICLQWLGIQRNGIAKIAAF